MVQSTTEPGLTGRLRPLDRWPSAVDLVAMTVLVTGATGFLGHHILEALAATDRPVRALCRSAAPELEARGITVVRGDVLDRASLDGALEGVSHVIHGAGLVSRDREDTRAMMRVHVAGTRHLMEAAIAAGVERVVHVSTSGTIAVGEDPDLVFHEGDPVPYELISRWPYYLSKLFAERAASDALRLAAKAGAERLPELVTLNPSLTLGPGDVRGSSTGDVRRFLSRQVPMVPTGGLSFVDARDVATAALAALDKGRDGERYLLGALNLTFADFFARLSEVSNVPGPAVNVKLPKGVVRFGVSLLERAMGAVGLPQPVTATEAEMAACFWYVDPRKAASELGFVARDPMRTLLDTVRDLRGEAPIRKSA